MTVSRFFSMLIAVITFIFSGSNPQTGMIGHRGCSGIYPDNTALAFEKAAEKGAVGCETDVRITKDGVFVLSHNAEVKFTDGTEAVVSETNYADLISKPIAKSMGKKIYLCSFEEYIKIMKQYNLICFIELKGEFSDEEIKSMFDFVREEYDISKCIMQSFEFENLIKAKRIVPDLPLMLTYGVGDGDYEKCFEYGISIDTDYNALTKEMVDDFHSRDLLVAAWTANSRFALTYCRAMGVDLVESDYFMK